MKYFRLFPEVIKKDGAVKASLYILLKKRVISLPESMSKIINESEQNISIENISEKYKIPLNQLESIFKSLEEIGAGTFYERPCFVEKIRQLNPIDEVTFFRPSPKINLLHINLSSSCSGKCSFCEPGKIVPRLQACMGCSKEIKEKESTLNIGQIEIALKEVRAFGCDTLVFHAGEYHKHKELLGESIEIAKNIGFSNIQLITGRFFSEDIIQLVVDFQLSPVFQFFSDNKENHDKVSAEEGSFLKLIDNISQLKENNLPFKIMYLHTGVENHPDKIVEQLSLLKPIEIFSDKLVDNVNSYNNFIKGEDFLKPPDINGYVAKKKNQSCMFGTITLNSNGNYIPCPGMKNTHLGKVGEVSIKQLFADEKMKQYWISKTNDTICANCEYIYACHYCHAIPEFYENSECIYGYKPSIGEWNLCELEDVMFADKLES